MNPITKYIVGVVVAIEHGGKILALKRSEDEESAPCVWELPAGKVELSELPYEAACREVIEECGINVSIDKQPIDAIQTTRKNDPMILVIYRGKYISGSVKLSKEHGEYEWLHPDVFADRTIYKSLISIVNDVCKSHKE